MFQQHYKATDIVVLSRKLIIYMYFFFMLNIKCFCEMYDYQVFSLNCHSYTCTIHQLHTIFKSLQRYGFCEFLHYKCQFLVTEVYIQLYLKCPAHPPNFDTAPNGRTCVLYMTGSRSPYFW